MKSMSAEITWIWSRKITQIIVSTPTCVTDRNKLGVRKAGFVSIFAPEQVARHSSTRPVRDIALKWGLVSKFSNIHSNLILINPQLAKEERMFNSHCWNRVLYSFQIMKARIQFFKKHQLCQILTFFYLYKILLTFPLFLAHLKIALFWVEYS